MAQRRGQTKDSAQSPPSPTGLSLSYRGTPFWPHFISSYFPYSVLPPSLGNRLDPDLSCFHRPSFVAPGRFLHADVLAPLGPFPSSQVCVVELRLHVLARFAKLIPRDQVRLRVVGIHNPGRASV